MDVRCPICGANLIECGIIRYETYTCEYRRESEMFERGLFDQEIWECPQCGANITDLISDGLSETC